MSTTPRRSSPSEPLHPPHRRDASDREAGLLGSAPACAAPPCVRLEDRAPRRRSRRSFARCCPGATSVDPAAPAFVTGSIRRRRTRRGSTLLRDSCLRRPHKPRGGRLRRKTPTWRGRWRPLGACPHAAAAAGPVGLSPDIERLAARSPRATRRATCSRRPTSSTTTPTTTSTSGERWPRRSRRRGRPHLHAPPPPAPATSYAPPPAGPRGEAEVLLREMGISPHLADLFVQQRDQPRRRPGGRARRPRRAVVGARHPEVPTLGARPLACVEHATR